MTSERRFGVSTHLFHESRLTREHLVHIAAHGFESVELFATRSHFDYRDARAIDELGEWLGDTQLELHSVHAPIFDAMQNGQWVGSYSIAAGDAKRRQAALAEIEAALAIATRVAFPYLVVHVGIPSLDGVRDDNQPDAARRSIEQIAEMAAARHVRVALEVIPNPLSSAAALAYLIEEQLDGVDAGICLDYGHAHMMGDLGDAVETVAGHLLTTHVHDNAGTRDDHLVPFSGTINWDAAMMATQKIGYDGVLMLEIANTGDPVAVLQRAVKARARLEKTFVTF